MGEGKEKEREKNDNSYDANLTVMLDALVFKIVRYITTKKRLSCPSHRQEINLLQNFKKRKPSWVYNRKYKF